MNPLNKVVVTGLGIVGGLGFDWASFWAGLTEGKSAVRPWNPPGAGDFPVRYAAPVDDAAFSEAFAEASELKQPMERRTSFGLMAARRALQDAGLGTEAPASMGVAVGSGVPERDLADMLLAVADNGATWDNLYAARGRLNPALRGSNDQLAVQIARNYGCRGPIQNFSTACAGAAHAIGSGFRMIRRGETDCLLAGGADSVLNLMTMVGLSLLGAPSTSEAHGERLCRPFDAERSGLVAAEGGAMVVLESEERARARGARIFAEIRGFGTSMDAYRITAPHPAGAGARLAMEKALSDAQVRPGEVDYINAHGTSTLLNDVAETRAIKQVFSEGNHFRKLAISANKSQTGHYIAASGAPEFIATALSLHFGILPPTLNLENPDPECDLDYVPHRARPAAISIALSNSFGFGGLNAALVLSRYSTKI